jgi:hypothetical protein
VDVGDDTSLGNGNIAKKSVELLVVSDAELNVSGDDSSLLVVAGSVTGELQNLSGQIFQHSGEVERGASSNAVGVLSLLQESTDSGHGESETGSHALGDLLLASTAASAHRISVHGSQAITVLSVASGVCQSSSSLSQRHFSW